MSALASQRPALCLSMGVSSPLPFGGPAVPLIRRRSLETGLRAVREPLGTPGAAAARAVRLAHDEP